MPIEIHVSRAGPYDPPSMAAIHRTCFAKAWDEATMAQFLASPEVLCLIAVSYTHLTLPTTPYV